MKKLIIGFAVIGSLTFVGAAGRALAADEAAGGGDKAAAAGGGDDATTTYKAKTVYDFEDDTVEGDFSAPTASSSARRRRPSIPASSRSAKTSSQRC